MSAPEFRSLFNSDVFRHWFNKSLNKSSNRNVAYDSFIHTGRAESKKFINNSTVDFVLTENTLAELIGSSNARQLFATLKSGKLSTELSGERAEFRITPSGQEQLFVKDLTFSTLNKHVANLLDFVGTEAGMSGVSQSVLSALKAKDMHKGHVFGFGNTLLMRTKQELENVFTNSGLTSEEHMAMLTALDNWIDSLVDILEDYDISTSDIKDLDTNLYAKYKKTSTNWLIEWQASSTNVESGNVIGRLFGKTGASTFVGARGVFTGKATETVVKNFIQQFITESVTAPSSSKLNILNQRSSPSRKDILADLVISTIKGTRPKLDKEYTGIVALPPIPQLVIANKQAIASNSRKAKETKTKLKQVKKSVAKAKAIAKNTRYTPTNLLRLQNLLNGLLVQRVKENMGDGTRRDILNLRSGRFAESVKVERLSESRQGMITAFYTYMKNPYATFSEGGRQQSPRSRDPKLLISKSIREIAAQEVANRMRAVLV